MGRHHDRKYGYGVAGYQSSHGRTGRVHQRMAQRRLAKQGVPSPMAIGMSRFGMAPLGLIGLVGVGILGYTLLKRRSFGFGWRKNALPITSAASVPVGTGFVGKRNIVGGVSAPIASTGISRVSPTMKERMGFTGHYPKVGIMGFVKSLKNKALYGTPYMIKEPVVPINSFRQVW